MIKKYFLMFAVGLFMSLSDSFSQKELWSKVAGGAGDDEAETVVSDSEGNVFVSGFFKSSTLTLGDKILKNKGGEAADFFIAKYDPSGKQLWAKSAGGNKEDEPLGMSVDKSGNVIIRGFFESEKMIFDGVEIKNNNKKDLSMFLVKYDPIGNLLWAKSTEVFASGHVLDAAGNIFVTGELNKGVKTSFDNFTFTPLEDGTFVAKYSPEGKVLWVKKGTGSEPFSISLDAAGNLFLSGLIKEKVHLMEAGQKITNVGTDRTSDIFLMKLSSDGNILWEKSIGGLGDEEPRAQLVSPSGNFYVVIRFTSIDLNLAKDAHRNGGGDDLLLIKYDPSGNVVWSKSAGGAGHDNPIFLVSDLSENIYLAGHYYSDNISFDQLTLKNVGLNDIFIVKCSPDSKVLWAKTTGGSHHDYPNGLIVDPLGNVYLIGEFNSSPNKDKIISEFFMEKYNSAGNSIWKSAEHRSESFDFAFGESIDKNGNMYLVGYFEGNMKFSNTDLKSNGGKDLFILKYSISNPEVKKEVVNVKTVKTTKKKK